MFAPLLGVPQGYRCATLTAVALFMGACSGGTVPPSPTGASPVTTVASVNPPAPEAVTPPGPVAPAPRVAAGTIASLAVEPARIRGGETPVGTLTLVAPAPAGGTVVTLTSSDRDVRPPATITIPAGQTIGMFQIPTSEPHADTDVRVTATTTDGTATTDILLVLPAPGARTDTYTMTGNTLTVPAPGVLDNDTRRTGHELTAELRTAPISGTVLLNANGGFTYRPNANFIGTDRFIYRAVDGATGSNLAHVWITVSSPQSPGSPVAVTPAPTGSQTFAFTGAAQTFTVPAGVTSITVEAFGAEGGTGRSIGGTTSGVGGLGGSVVATIAVTAGDTYQVNVGGRGTDGGAVAGNGGGGGGASDIRNGALALADRLVVAGGGAGGGLGAVGFGIGGDGGAGGSLTGATGSPSGGGATGGGGGTQAAGGTGGPGGFNGAAGGLGVGGSGGGNAGSGPAGGFNGGADGDQGGGGGGGGYFGGGGGGHSNTGAGGGGGSSFTTAGATSITHQQGVRSGNGQIIIRW